MPARAVLPVPGGPPVAWHTRSVASALEAFGADAAVGLAEEEAARRLLADGPNALVEGRRSGFLIRDPFDWTLAQALAAQARAA